VLFCDLADSTRLASQLDPEDLREVMLAYQATCVEVIQRLDGHVAQYLGDGLLVYFGYPQAHEDDAQRAVRTGLGILDAMGTLDTRLERDRGIRLAVRIGIHTGPVVVGTMGSGGRHEQLALGETPNLAARLQSLAAPNTVAISATTHRLVQGYFRCDDLGSPSLKGVETPLRVYRVVAESAAQNRLDVAGATGLTPLVGREPGVGLLRQRWTQSRDGLGQVVLLSHEQAEAAVAFSTAQGFPQWAALGTSLRGWALAVQGQGEEGMAQIRQGIAAYRATGGVLVVPYLCTVLADVDDHLGHTEEGLQALAEAHTLVEQHEERYWEAEVCRLRGVLLLQQTGTPQEGAEVWLWRALDVARHQEAKSLELRAATSLSRLWQQQGKRVEARELLAPVYGWFTEGFDTADLQEAKALLKTLA
jgi:class 3 adenylate cyclase